MKYFSLWLLLLFNAAIANGQSSTSITVFASDSDAPLTGAAIIDTDNPKKGWITDIDGRVSLDITQPTEVKVSFIGFLPKVIMVSPGEKATIILQEDALGLEEIIVTGSFKPTTVENSLYRVKKLGVEMIESRGAVNLGDLLQVELNSKIIQDDVLGSRIVLQGISGPNVKILIDGLPLINGEGGEFDLNQINMNNVERVEIVEGPLSVQYGTNALAGTINIITRDYTASDDIHTGINTYYESIGQYNVDGFFGKGWKNFSVNIAGGRNRFEGFSSTDERSKNWNPKTQYFANVKLVQKLNKIKATFTHNHLWENTIGLGNASSAFNPITSKLSMVANDRYNYTARHNTALFIEGKLTENTYINIISGNTYFKRATQKYIQDVVDDFKWLSQNPIDHDTTSFSGWNFRGTFVQENIGNKKTSIVAGYDINLNEAAGGRINAAEVGAINDYAAFTALNFSIGPHIDLQGALRYTYNNTYDTREINFLGANLPLLPSINLLYKINPNLRFRASYGKGFRTPSVRELYYEFIDANHYIVGNVALLPEVGNNFSFSMDWKKRFDNKSIAISPSLFFNTIDNKIELVRILDRSLIPEEVPKNVPVARTYANISNFKSHGMNLNAALIMDNGLELRPGFGILARSGDAANGKFYYSKEFNLNASYFIKSLSTRFNVFFKHNGEITEFSLNEDGSTGTLTMDDYNTLDISVTKPFLDNHVLVTLGGKNLFNVTDVSLFGEGSKGLVLQTGREPFYPVGWGTTFFIKLNYTFNK